MDAKHVDYDRMATEYDRRFTLGLVSNTARALHEHYEQVNGGRILEVGCGTGHWLEVISAPDRSLIGLDFSRGMLAHPRRRKYLLSLYMGLPDSCLSILVRSILFTASMPCTTLQILAPSYQKLTESCDQVESWLSWVVAPPRTELIGTSTSILKAALRLIWNAFPFGRQSNYGLK